MTIGERTWVVTGGAGFIGSALVRAILRTRAGVRVRTFDALTYAGVRTNLDHLDAEGLDGDRHELIVGDVRDQEAVAAAVRGATVVFHLAAESHVDRSIASAQVFADTNVRGTQVVLDAARAAGARVVLASTDEVYGDLPLETDRRFVETDPFLPRSPYAASKAGAELLARAAFVTHGQDVVIGRGCNTLGPRQFPEKLVPLFVTNLLLGRAVPLYGDGSNVREWLHVDDHAEAMVMLAERGTAGEAYNIGADNERTNLDVARTIIDLMGADGSRIERVPDRAGHDLRYALDTEKIRTGLGWSPSRSAWPDALAQTLSWYRDNEAWWRSLRG